MKSSWEAEPLFPNGRRFGRAEGFSVKLDGFWEGPISERTVNIGTPESYDLATNPVGSEIRPYRPPRKGDSHPALAPSQEYT
jgi:hypothetical protein